MSKPIAQEVTFTPVDNRRLSNVCGALDENLRQIEAALDVAIARRGEEFTLSGDKTQVDLAAKAIRKFYAEGEHELTVEDIQLGLVEVQRIANGVPSAAKKREAEASVAEDEEATPILQTRRRDLHGRTPRQVQYIKNVLSHDITFGVGPAGTGKTYLAVACAVDALERDAVKRIVLTRPAVEAGERLGYLPGDIAQKVDPYLRPLYDALYDLMGFDRFAKHLERGVIEIAPLAFMRGRTLNHSFVILDEAQNTTPEQMKMFLTRIGFGSKAVVTGDVTQIDLPKNAQSGLVHSRHVLANVRGIAFSLFQKDDVVRHPLVARIVEAYEKHSNP